MRATLLFLSLAALAACNDHPLLPLEASLSGGMRETVEYPRVSNVDFLFVVDDSGSMAEEQANLAHNVEALAGRFATGLGGHAPRALMRRPQRRPIRRLLRPGRRRPPRLRPRLHGLAGLPAAGRDPGRRVSQG